MMRRKVTNKRARQPHEATRGSQPINEMMIPRYPQPLRIRGLRAPPVHRPSSSQDPSACTDEYWARWRDANRRQRWYQFCWLVHEVQSRFDAVVECLALQDDP